jgi:hypothetical protein
VLQPQTNSAQPATIAARTAIAAADLRPAILALTVCIVVSSGFIN